RLTLRPGLAAPRGTCLLPEPLSQHALVPSGLPLQVGWVSLRCLPSTSRPLWKNPHVGLSSARDRPTACPPPLDEGMHSALARSTYHILPCSHARVMLPLPIALLSRGG